MFQVAEDSPRGRGIARVFYAQPQLKLHGSHVLCPGSQERWRAGRTQASKRLVA